MIRDSIKKNYVFNLCYQIFTMIAPLITTPYISRILQVDGVGAYSYTYTIATVFVAFSQLGTVSYATREIAYHQNDCEGRSLIFWNVFLLRCGTSLVSAIIYFVVFCRGELKDLFILQAMCIVGVVFDISWYFQGIEHFKEIAIRDILSKIISIVCIFVFVKEKNDILVYTFILNIFTILGRIVNWVLVPKYLCKVDIKKICPLKNLKVIFTLFIPQIANQLYIAIDKSMIGMMSDGTSENGFYAQADRIIKLCIAVLTSVVTVMGPRIAECYSRNDDDSIQSYTIRIIRTIWMLGASMAVGACLTISTITPWFFGPGYEKVANLIYIFSPQIVLIGFTTFTGMLLVNTRDQKSYAISVVVGVCVNILLNSLLIPLYYSQGAAIASVVAEMIILVVQLVRAKRLISFKRIITLSTKYIVAAGIMGIFLLIVKGYTTSTIVGTSVLLVCGMVSYFGVLILFKDSFFINILKGILKTRGVKKNI